MTDSKRVTREGLDVTCGLIWRSLWTESASTGWHGQVWLDEDVIRQFQDGRVAAAIFDALPTDPPASADVDAAWEGLTLELWRDEEVATIARHRPAIEAAIRADHDCFWDGPTPKPPREPQDIASLRMDVTDAEADAFMDAIEPRAESAATLDVEEGIVQRAHVACCWCGEHHEDGR